MKILFISAQYPPTIKGGGEISTHLIASALQNAGNEVAVLAEGDVFKEEYIDGVQVIRMPLGLTQKPLFERIATRVIAHAIDRAIALDTFDIVHAHDFRSALALAELIALRKFPAQKAVVTLRDYAMISGDTNYILRDGTIPSTPLSLSAYWNSYRVHETNIFIGIARFLQYAMNTRYRNTIFSKLENRVYISHAQQREIQKHAKRGKRSQVIYNPVDMKPLAAHTRSNRALYAGRIEEYKGVKILLEAWSIVVTQFADAQLYLAGQGAQQNEYEQLVAKLTMEKNVSFLGHMPPKELEKEYNACDVVIAPSLWIEPFGRTVAEGFAHNRVVVATKNGGPGELITSGVTGFTCTPGKVGELAATLLEVFTLEETEYIRVANAGHAWAAENLSPAKIAGQYIAFYESALRP